MTDRYGDWMQTFSGVKFWPLDPRPEDVRLEDIAHALSLQCRFAGHCRHFYSVAQHSVLVSSICPPDGKLHGLFHDAAEAYLQDMIRPLKSVDGFSACYRAAEQAIMDVICRRFGFPLWQLHCVSHADEILLATEARDLMGGESAGKWSLRAEPLPERISGWPAPMAEQVFLDAAEALIARGVQS